MSIEKCFAARATKTTIVVHVVRRADFKEWVASQSASVRRWISANHLEPRVGKTLLIPERTGAIWGALFIRSNGTPSPLEFARIPAALPAGRYKLEGIDDPVIAESAALGWALALYRFDRYKSARRDNKRQLVWPKGTPRKRVLRLAESTYLIRDMITTPTEDMGPAEMEEVARDMAKLFGAKVRVTTGAALLQKNYPAIHAVGRASVHEPRLIDMRWGSTKHPKVTIVGKGVCFDSGGLDLKPAGSMLLMKKDMGGGAHALGLARAVMDAGLKVRLRVLVPAVENSVAGNAFRPLDVLDTRKGLTVEVGNTDAEGRLVLCDALHEASLDKPELLIDFATLTGAARVALGTALPALFSNDDTLAQELLDAGLREHDPLWRLPLHAPYARYLESRVADVSNTASTRYGGAITAALFLKKFVGNAIPWVHIDLMAWNNDNRPGAPKGGEAMTLRAFYALLESRYR